MRIPKYLSYSSFNAWESDPERGYLRSCSETRPEREPQERPAGTGSAFDAKVKSELHAALFGKGTDPKYEYDALFVSQVEPQNRDWCKSEGEYIFEKYKELGAYDALLEQLKKSIESPRFEFTVHAMLAGVPTEAKPDCRWVAPGGVHIIHDFKVNGYCSKNATSPTKGYAWCRPDEKAHKLYEPFDYKGIIIDKGYLEDVSTDWADQLSIYGWALGEKPGDETVVLSIHQLVFKPVENQRPILRVAEYKARVRDTYQHYLLDRWKKCWHHISTGHVLPHLSKEESLKRCKLLDAQAEASFSDGSAEGEFYKKIGRSKYRG